MPVSNGNQEVSESDLRLDRLASVGQIAAGIAHEVKNPLTAVKGFLQLLKEESNHKYLDYAYSELENAISTLQNLLSVSKPDLEDEPFDIIDLTAELESLLYLFQEKTYQIAIERHFLNTDARVYGKRNQLKKAFFNLLKNAFEAISNRGTIRIKHYEAGEHLVIVISDTGIGIPEDKLKLLGTPFYTSKVEGTGMGLTQAFSTIYEHDGMIRVKSEVGKGTEFTVHLPIYKERGGVAVELKYEPGQSFSQFYESNQDVFFQLLKQQGEKILNMVTLADLDAGYILESTHAVVCLLNEQNVNGLILHAKEHGRNWAKHNLDLILKLEWIQMLRRAYWDLLFHYYKDSGQQQQSLFDLGREINDHIDSYEKHFASSYMECKNEQFYAQCEMSSQSLAQIIPLADGLALLPAAGIWDVQGDRKNQDFILGRIYELKLHQLIIDLSGISYINQSLVSRFNHIVQGAFLQGCKVTLTGMCPEMSSMIMELGINLHEKVETRGTVQQALG
ncbi:ATP-binding protein [Paenibacillus sanguinis]|uniref:ATP-binding protein n=1 Tax=Paenibacillus sanguinis TaxID=225906 RepID=UPI00037B6CA4|nr:ATP-binding protein [Paenibacillus sanguinis]